MASATEAVAAALLREQQSGKAYRDLITTDPVELIAFGDCAGVFIEHDGDTYYRDSTEGYALLGAKQLRIIANELDNRNGVPVQSEAADEDGTYSIRGLSRPELLAITQLVGLSRGPSKDACAVLHSSWVHLVEAACNAAFPDFKVEASF